MGFSALQIKFTAEGEKRVFPSPADLPFATVNIPSCFGFVKYIYIYIYNLFCIVVGKSASGVTSVLGTYAGRVRERESERDLRERERECAFVSRDCSV
jgi:hypothetical protein